jgi:hypothetical protein
MPSASFFNKLTPLHAAPPEPLPQTGGRTLGGPGPRRPLGGPGTRTPSPAVVPARFRCHCSGLLKLAGRGRERHGERHGESRGEARESRGEARGRHGGGTGEARGEARRGRRRGTGSHAERHGRGVTRRGTGEARERHGERHGEAGGEARGGRADVWPQDPPGKSRPVEARERPRRVLFKCRERGYELFLACSTPATWVLGVWRACMGPRQARKLPSSPARGC